MGRSGSTILHRALGQVEGFFAAGELHLMWERNLISNRLCGCGRQFRNCNVWAAVFNDAFNGFDGIDACWMESINKSMLRTRHIPRLLIRNRRAAANYQLNKYSAELSKLYASIAEVSASEIIVDSSKVPMYAHVLSLIPSIELHIVHLIRDPRAVAYSWRKRKKQPDGGSTEEIMGQMKPWFSSLLWNVWNLYGEKIGKTQAASYSRVYYEEFTKTPKLTIEKILQQVGKSSQIIPVDSEGVVNLSLDHTVSGNPNRFQTGKVAIKSDDTWGEKIKLSDYYTSTLLTLPLLFKYKYI